MPSGRDFDEAESAFIKETGMTAYSVRDIRSDRDLIHRKIEGIHSEHIYVHFELDRLVEAWKTPRKVRSGVYSN